MGEIPGDGLDCRQQCSGSEMVNHVGTRVIRWRMCSAAKEMRIKCLWTWGRHCTLSRVGQNESSAHSSGSGMVVGWNGHKNITGCQTSGSRGEREMRGFQSTESQCQGPCYLNYSSKPLADLLRCRPMGDVT